MWSLLRNDRVYDQITGIALGIGFFATIVMTYLPQFTGIAVIVMVLATLTAMVVYFVAKCRPVHDEKVSVNLPKERTAERTSIQSEAATQQRREPDAAPSEKPITEERADTPPIRQAQSPPSVPHKSPPVTMTPEAYREAVVFLQRISELSVSHTWNRQLEHNFRKSVFTFDIGEIARGLYRERLNDVDYNALLSSYTGRLARSQQFRRIEDPSKPIIIKIGPVTVEIADNETRVNVESPKAVVTNVSAPERAAADPTRESPDTEKPPRRTVH